MRRTLIAALTSLTTLACGGEPPTSGSANLVVTNARIYTVDATLPEAEAMAVVDGRIAAIGTAAEIEPWISGETEVVDAAGGTVIPGLIDAHAHVMNLGEFLRNLDLVDTTSAEEITQMVADAAASRPAGSWITGRGWDQNDWEDVALPTRELLDAATAEHPVYLRRIDGHAFWVNGVALDLAGITADTPDPDGGRIIRDQQGRPTGVLVDNAMPLIADLVPDPDAEELAARLAVAQEHMVSMGLTGVQDMGASQGLDQAPYIDLYLAWDASDRLLPRIAVLLDGRNERLVESWLERGPRVDTEGRAWVKAVKFYADGALGSRGAALLEEYSDDPGNEGLLVTAPEVLRERVQRAAKAGFQPGIHAIGDRGNRVALDALAGIDPAVRPRIEHAQVVALDDIPRFRAQSVIASIQPTHATSDMYWAEDRVGPDRIQGAYAWRKLRDSGAILVCGSDFPVENANPFHGLYAAITRQDQKGWPAGGWYPAERMSRQEALRCFTIDAARSAFMEDHVGSLTVGKWADFLILDRDIMSVAEEEIWQTRVVRTVIAGNTVYSAEAE